MIDNLLSRSGDLDAETLRTLRTAGTCLANELGPALAALVRCPVEVSLAAIDPRTYGEFLDGLRVPSCFNVLRVRGLPGLPHGDKTLRCDRGDGWNDCLLLDIELAIVFPMLDRLLGGVGDDQPPSRPLTEIELPLAARLVGVFLRCLESGRSGNERSKESRRARAEVGEQHRAYPAPLSAAFRSMWSRFPATRGCSAHCPPMKRWWPSAFGSAWAKVPGAPPWPAAWRGCASPAGQSSAWPAR